MSTSRSAAEKGAQLRQRLSMPTVGVMADVLHHTHLPFTVDQLREHFAPVLGPGERDRHLRYYLASVEEARRYDELIRRGDKPTPVRQPGPPRAGAGDRQR